MFHHGSQRDRHNGEHGADERFAAVHGKQTHGILVQGQTDPGGSADGLKVNRAGNKCHSIGNQNTDQDGQNLDHALAPDVADDNGGQCHNGQQPVALAVADGAGGQNQADGNDDGAGDNRGEELHHLADAERGNQRAEQHIHKAGQCHSRAGVGQVLGVLTVVGHNGKAAQIGKAGAKECRNLALAQEVEQQRAQTGAQQGGADAQTGQQGNEHSCAEHCKHVLRTQNEQLGCAELLGIIDALRVIHFFCHE